MSKPLMCVAGTTIAFVLGVSAAHAALTTANCLAKKRLAHGKLQQCRAAAEAKALQGKPADLGKCSTKFQEQLAKLTDKASDAGIGCRYRDNGNGTVSDFDKGLQWEQKNGVGGGTDFANARDVDNIYSWSSAGTQSCPSGGTSPSGTAFTDFLSRLNNCTFAPGIVLNFTGFAGHCDWRLPTLTELQGLQLVPCVGGPCIDPAFGPVAGTTLAPYWSRTSFTGGATAAWFVDFRDGSVTTEPKVLPKFVRAVRDDL